MKLSSLLMVAVLCLIITSCSTNPYDKPIQKYANKNGYGLLKDASVKSATVIDTLTYNKMWKVMNPEYPTYDETIDFTSGLLKEANENFDFGESQRLQNRLTIFRKLENDKDRTFYVIKAKTKMKTAFGVNVEDESLYFYDPMKKVVVGSCGVNDEDEKPEDKIATYLGKLYL